MHFHLCMFLLTYCFVAFSTKVRTHKANWAKAIESLALTLKGWGFVGFGLLCRGVGGIAYCAITSLQQN